MNTSAVNGPPPRVYVIDGDESVRRSLVRLLRSTGVTALAFNSADEFLLSRLPLRNVCIIADVCMTGTSGLELQKRLAASGAQVPFIFLAARDDVETRRQARLAQAVGYFRKPVDGQALLDSIAWALSNPASEDALRSETRK